MNIGSLVLATAQGIGHMARAFYDHGLIQRVLINRHPRRPTHMEWYPDAQLYEPERVEAFLDGLDALLIIEKVPKDQWWVIEAAKALGVRIVLIPMHEATPDPIPVDPDRVLCPSLLEVERFGGPNNKISYLPVPVVVPWVRRRRARVWVHNAGNAQGMFRNGTLELLTALPMILNPIKLILRMQEPVELTPLSRGKLEQVERLLEAARHDRRVEIVDRPVAFDELWHEGDVFVFPEKWNGLSLPLQEARASGMLVMASNRFPNNAWLPPEPLIPVSAYRRVARFGVPFDEAIVDPAAVAATVDRWAGADISAYSDAGRIWARAHSWERLRQPYLDAILGNVGPNPANPPLAS